MELVLFIGLQASGKTSYFRERFAATHFHASMDHWPNARHPRRRLEREVEAALLAGRDVVCDNTAPTRADRAPLIALGRRLGARVRAIYFQSTVADALRRNAQRTGRSRVRDVAVFATVARLAPPALDEGWDEIQWVRLGEDGFEAVQAEQPAPR